VCNSHLFLSKGGMHFYDLIAFNDVSRRRQKDFTGFDLS